jgi:hypothetical protein
VSLRRAVTIVTLWAVTVSGDAAADLRASGELRWTLRWRQRKVRQCRAVALRDVSVTLHLCVHVRACACLSVCWDSFCVWQAACRLLFVI